MCLAARHTPVTRRPRLLCDEGGFLVEAKLTRLLAPLPHDQQDLMRLDSIFKVCLGLYASFPVCGEGWRG